jgi:hypothetical protein
VQLSVERLSVLAIKMSWPRPDACEIVRAGPKPHTLDAAELLLVVEHLRILASKTQSFLGLDDEKDELFAPCTTTGTRLALANVRSTSEESGRPGSRA